MKKILSLLLISASMFAMQPNQSKPQLHKYNVTKKAQHAIFGAHLLNESVCTSTILPLPIPIRIITGIAVIGFNTLMWPPVQQQDKNQ